MEFKRQTSFTTEQILNFRLDSHFVSPSLFIPTSTGCDVTITICLYELIANCFIYMALAADHQSPRSRFQRGLRKDVSNRRQRNRRVGLIHRVYDRSWCNRLLADPWSSALGTQCRWCCAKSLLNVHWKLQRINRLLMHYCDEPRQILKVYCCVTPVSQNELTIYSSFAEVCLAKQQQIWVH